MIDSISLFLQKCEEWRVTVLDLPTAFWHELTRKIAADAITLPRSMRLIIIGGERALPEMLALWQKSGNRHVKLMNTYGPTEGTIVATMYEVPESTAARSTLREVPIGRPVSNVQVYLLDRYLNAVPIGVPGELHIGGAGLAREYLNRPVITREKFIAHPFDQSAEARLYKTGDRARYLPSGDIEFLGRLDQQVKVRGYRIELGEIEATLWKHADIHEAIVVAREDATGGKRLVAYVVPRRGRSLSSRDLHSFMREQLPDYMVPSSIVLLESLPLTPSGKIDRLALPAPEQNRLETEETHVAPTIPEQQQLIEVWEELLDVRPIGIQDNFFQLGGHSLLAVRLVDRIEQMWGKKVSATTLVENATVEQLVAVLFQAKDSSKEAVKASARIGTGSESNKGLSSPGKTIWSRLTGRKKQR
jgi:acyl-CoA synthetase (AMP-forming)/AMP-acid ligase II/acyl carrier protein